MFIGLFLKTKHHHFYALHYKKKQQANKINYKKFYVFCFNILGTLKW